MTCYAPLTVGSRTGPSSRGAGGGLGVRPPAAAGRAGPPAGAGAETARGDARSRATLRSPVHTSLGAAACWLPGRRRHSLPHFSASRGPGPVALHILHGTNGLSPHQGQHPVPPHSSAGLTNTVFHTVCLPLHLPSPPCPSPVQHGLGPGLVSFPVRGVERRKPSRGEVGVAGATLPGLGWAQSRGVSECRCGCACKRSWCVLVCGCDCV